MKERSRIIRLNETNFQKEVLEADRITLVFFMTEWKGICQVITPILEKISAQFADQFLVGTVDVDSNEELAEEHGVVEIPTILFFKDGRVIDQITGSISRKALEKKWMAIS